MVIIGINRVDKMIRKNIRSLNSAGILVASGTAYRIIPKTRVGISNG
jgi:sugar diacid utilization regulator